ncbi:hypothetical protein Bbelb_021650 [Branchiostoma belcheri]|nr:hypothetical protein Bbelb_021650 [Branchiostoma belcheri]
MNTRRKPTYPGRILPYTRPEIPNIRTFPGVRDPYTWRVRARTRPGYEPLRCPGHVQACTRLHTPPLVTGADISLVWAPVVRSRPKLFIPRCATSLAEAVTHGPNILCPTARP